MRIHFTVGRVQFSSDGTVHLEMSECVYCSPLDPHDPSGELSRSVRRAQPIRQPISDWICQAEEDSTAWFTHWPLWPHCLCAALPYGLSASVQPCLMGFYCLCAALPYGLTASVQPCLMASLPLCSLALWPHCLCAALPYGLTASVQPCLMGLLPLCSLALWPYCLCAALPYGLTASVQPCLMASLPLCSLALWPYCLCAALPYGLLIFNVFEVNSRISCNLFYDTDVSLTTLHEIGDNLLITHRDDGGNVSPLMAVVFTRLDNYFLMHSSI